MRTKVAFEQVGYLREHLIAVGNDVDKLDLSATTSNLISSGYADRIEAYGTRPLYRVWEIDIPDWLIAGVARGQQDGRWPDGNALWNAVRITANPYNEDVERALSRLAFRDRVSKFERSLQTHFATHGIITARQAACVR